jgi:hypothetical protein
MPHNRAYIDLIAMTRIAAIVLALLLLFFVPATAAADGSGACTFSGTVRLDGAEVGDGTLVTAVIDGDEYHTHTSTGYGYSTYSLTIRAPDGKNYPDGSKVTFKVNGHTTSQTTTFKAGANVRLDLTASSASTLSSANIAIIAGLLLAILAAAAAYYFLIRRRGLGIKNWLEPRRDVPSGGARPLAVEGQGQAIPRYVWDSAKLAWVENTDPAKVKPQMGQPVMKSVTANVPVAAGAGVARQKGQDKSVTVSAQNGVVSQKQAAPMPGKEAAYNDEVPMLCHGNVNLWVISPSGMAQLQRFSNHVGHLKRNHEIKVKKIDFLSRQSICFELLLQRPIPLLKILKELPEVATVSDGLRNSLESYRAMRIRSQANARLVEVKLKA